MSVINLFRKRESEEERETRELLEAIQYARDEMKMAQAQFNNAVAPELVEASVYEISSAQARYNFLLKRAREEGLVNMEGFKQPR